MTVVTPDAHQTFGTGLAVEIQTAVYGWALMSNHAHLLLKSSAYGLPGFMRRLLTGYAVTYNLRHRRHGQLTVSHKNIG